MSAALVVQAHEIELWIFDAPACEGVDVNICLIPGRDRDRSAVPFQEAFVETVHVLHEWYLEMQTRASDRVTDRFSKLRNNHLLGLIHRIEDAGKYQGKEKDNCNYRRKGKILPSHCCRFSPGLVERGRIGSSCRIDSSTIIFCPV